VRLPVPVFSSAVILLASAGKSYVIFGKTDTNAIDLSKLGDKSKYTIDYLGDKNANILTGTTKDEIFFNVLDASVTDFS
jgi:hypothetical protein